MWHYIVIIKNFIVLDSEQKLNFQGYKNASEAAHHAGIACGENELNDPTMRIITYKNW